VLLLCETQNVGVHKCLSKTTSENRTKREQGVIGQAAADTYMETIANIKQSGKWLVVTYQSCGRTTQGRIATYAFGQVSPVLGAPFRLR
jgi:hypothetical protein